MEKLERPQEQNLVDPLLARYPLQDLKIPSEALFHPPLNRCDIIMHIWRRHG